MLGSVFDAFQTSSHFTPTPLVYYGVEGYNATSTWLHSEETQGSDYSNWKEKKNNLNKK